MPGFGHIYRNIMYYRGSTEPVSGHQQAFIMHGEVLLRILDKDSDIVSANLSLPAAERYNMAILIDEQVFEKSIQ